MAEVTSASFVTFDDFNPGPYLENRHLDGDVEMTEVDSDLPEETIAADMANSDRLVIAVDFGTTFCSVAYATVTKDKPRSAMTTKDIKCISRYPDSHSISNGTYDPENSREDVPTELWYNLDALKNRKPSTSPPPESGSSASPVDNDNDSEMDGEFTDDEDTGYDELLWGFGVQKHMRKMDVPKDGTTRLTRFKLLLDEKSEGTTDLRGTLENVIKRLKRGGVAKSTADFIADYLQRLFVHTKAMLQESGVLKHNMPIEFVLCVPAVWPSKASRVMQVALSKAVELSGLGSLTNKGLDNLFIVSEPEAAAACVLAEDNDNVKVGFSVT
jgi:hypothetical protein